MQKTYSYMLFITSKNNYFIITENSKREQTSMRVATPKEIATLVCVAEID